MRSLNGNGNRPQDNGPLIELTGVWQFNSPKPAQLHTPATGTASFRYSKLRLKVHLGIRSATKSASTPGYSPWRKRSI